MQSLILCKIGRCKDRSYSS